MFELNFLLNLRWVRVGGSLKFNIGYATPRLIVKVLNLTFGFSLIKGLFVLYFPIHASPFSCTFFHWKGRGEKERMGIVPEIRNFKKGKDRVAPEMTNKRNKVYHLKWGVTFAPGHECVLY